MTDLTALVTGCGAPGTIGTRWSLMENPDGRSIRTVGTDLEAEQPGRFVCDSFHTVPPGGDDAFVAELISICESEDVDVILPQVTAELPALASSRSRFAEVGTTVAVSGPSAIERANDKAHLLEVCADLGVPYPETVSVSTWSELEAVAEELGFPDQPVAVKPPVANGQRGFRIVSSEEPGLEEFYGEKPDGTRTTMAQLQSILGEEFPRLLVMEYLPGEEFSVDAFRYGDESVVLPRSRDAIRSGISFRTTIREEPALIDHVETLAEELDLEYAFGFQFKRAADGTLKILECNPRIQGTMVASTLAGANLVYAAATSAAGAPTPEFEPEWGTTFYRYWGGLGVSEDRVVGNIGDQS